MGRGLVMDRAQRGIVGVAFPAAFVAAVVVPYLLFRSELPSPIAVHFDADGAADGSMPVAGFLLLVGALAVGSAVVLVLAAWRPGSMLGIQAATATFVGVTSSWVSLLVLLANESHDRWQDVTLGSGALWGATASALGASVPVALMVRRYERPATPSPAGRVPVAAGERAAWFGSARSLPVGVVTLALAYVSTVVVITFGSGAFLSGVAVLAVALALALFIEVRVRISGEGVTVRSGLARWPRVRIPLDRIDAAQAIDLQPLRWGGWGYRGSVRLFRRAAWVVRKGPALELALAGDRRFAVTVDDADEAAAVLNGLLARTGGEARQ